MKAKIIYVMLLVAGVLSFAGYPQYLHREGASGEVIVGFEKSVTTTAAASQVLGASLQAYGGEIIDIIPELDAVRIRVPDGREQSFVSATMALSGVKYAEPNILVEAYATPNDPKWAEQWGPVAIQAPKAWETTTGKKEILVAVVDTGVDYTHPDLAKAYVPIGYDFVDDDDDPHPLWEPHGTHVAGIIAATINNGVGIAGIANVSIMAVRVLGLNGQGRVWDVAHGIVYAVRKLARVINLSLGTFEESKLLKAAVEFALAAGCVVVASAGNAGSAQVGYPAAYTGVIAVSAVDKDGKLADFSSYGPEIDLAAPGVKILSTVPIAEYKAFSGTSMAAPHVTGVVALMLSVNPRLTTEQVLDILHKTAKDLGDPGRDQKYGYGLVDAYAAVQEAQKTQGGGTVPPPSTSPSQLYVKTDKQQYQLGETVRVIYTLPEQGQVSIYRIASTDMPEKVYSRTTSPGTYELPITWQATKCGIETIVIQVKTSTGRIFMDAWTYTVGFTPGTARVWTDRDCGSTYRIGDQCIIYFQVENPGTVLLFDFSSDGSVSKLLETRLAAGERYTVRARITGPVGTELLVLQMITQDGVTTSYCKFEIAE